MSGVPSAASLDKDWEIDKIHSNTDAIMEATPVTEPLRRPRASPLAINAAAIGAILLRDIRLRAGPYYTGFLMILLMPLAHLLIVVMVFRIFGRLAPQGTDQIVYFGISILPFVTYVYLSRQVVIVAHRKPSASLFQSCEDFRYSPCKRYLGGGRLRRCFYYCRLHIGGLFN